MENALKMGWKMDGKCIENAWGMNGKFMEKSMENGMENRLEINGKQMEMDGT